MKALTFALSLALAAVLATAAPQNVPTQPGTFSRIYFRDGATTGPQLRWGAGSPNGAVSAPRGSTYQNTTDGSIWKNTNGGTAWSDLSNGGNPFNQSLNTSDDVTFDALTVTSCTGCGGVTPGSVLLEQHSASSSASLDFTTFYSSTYDTYEIHFVGLVPATNTVSPYLRMSTNGGSSYDSGSNYAYAAQWSVSPNASGATTSNSDTKIVLGDSVGNAGTSPFAGRLTLYSPGSTALYKTVVGKFGYIKSDGNALGYDDFGTYKSTTAVNAFQFFFSSGNITSGTIRVYGIAK